MISSTTLAAADYGKQITCLVQREGITLAYDSEENLSEAVVNLRCNVVY